MVDRRAGLNDDVQADRVDRNNPYIHIEKHPYVPLQRISEGMQDSQKSGVKMWNSMVKKLNEAGLMKSKEEKE